MTYVIKPQNSNSDNFAERQPDSQHSARLEGFPLNSTTPEASAKTSHNDKHNHQPIDYLATASFSLITPEQLAAENRKTEQSQVGSKPIFAPLGLSDLLNRPAKTFLVESVFGSGDMGMVYGPPGSGKTFVVIDLLFSCCTGRQWARRFNVNRSLNVAYCAGEGVSGLAQRFAAAAHFYDVTELPNFTFFDVIPQLYADGSTETELATINRFIAEWQTRQEQGQASPLDLLILDTFHSATAGADENSARDMGKVLHLLRLASKTLGCAVLLVHHSNKAGTGERGSSALRGAMDYMLEIKEAGSKFLMSCEKIKDGEKWRDQTFDLTSICDSVRVWWDETADDSASRTDSKQGKDVGAIVALLKGSSGKRYTANTIAEAIGMGGSKQVFKLLPLAMTTDEQIKCGLRDPEKDSSPHNPMVYWRVPDGE